MQKIPNDKSECKNIISKTHTRCGGKLSNRDVDNEDNEPVKPKWLNEWRSASIISLETSVRLLKLNSCYTYHINLIQFDNLIFLQKKKFIWDKIMRVRIAENYSFTFSSYENKSKTFTKMRALVCKFDVKGISINDN